MFKSKNLIRGGEIKPTDLFVLHIDSHGTFHGTGFEIFNPLIFLIGLSIHVKLIIESKINTLIKIPTELTFRPIFDVAREELYSNGPHDPTEAFKNKTIKQLL
ncbi:unnamed protein product [Rotaria sordida]|uniref:Uncharacterized protein n=1 Tax=Rotaria sordida TaxID=392033 RepID=A0A815AWC6_9BILA|nr:unnamed protein product [Rotaria sordida]